MNWLTISGAYLLMPSGNFVKRSWKFLVHFNPSADKAELTRRNDAVIMRMDETRALSS